MLSLIFVYTSLFLLLFAALMLLACNIKLWRSGAAPSLAAWLIAPGLLFMQAMLVRMAPQLGFDRGFDTNMLGYVVLICCASLLSCLVRAARGGLALRRDVSLKDLAWLGAGGIGALVALGALEGVVLAAAAIGVAALRLVPDEDRARPLPASSALAVGALWALMLGALALRAQIIHADGIVSALSYAKAWPSAAWLNEADATYARTLILAALTGLSGLFTMAACLSRSRAALRHDTLGRVTLALGSALCLLGLGGLGGLGGFRVIERHGDADDAMPQLTELARLARLPSVPPGLPVPSALDSAMPAGVPQGYSESSRRRSWYASRRCAATLEGGAWRFAPLGDATGCESDPEPLVLLPAAASAQEAASALARSAFKNTWTTLDPPPLTRYINLADTQTPPYILLEWRRAEDWRSWDPNYVMLVRRGERNHLFCKREKLYYPEGRRWEADSQAAREREHDVLYGDEGQQMELNTWKARVNRLERGGEGSEQYDVVEQRYVALGARPEGWRAEAAAACGAKIAISIAPGEQTVQEVVDVCALMQERDYGCVVIDRLPDEVTRGLTELEGRGAEGAP